MGNHVLPIDVQQERVLVALRNLLNRDAFIEHALAEEIRAAGRRLRALRHPADIECEIAALMKRWPVLSGL